MDRETLVFLLDTYAIATKDRALEERICKVSRGYCFTPGMRERSHRQVLRYLDTDEERGAYVAIVAKRESVDVALKAWADYLRIEDPRGVTIHVEPSDDDPLSFTLTISDELADEWAGAHGALFGGTWETADGTDFVYDYSQWYPKIWDEVREYDLDFSQWGDPTEEEIAIAQHAADCEECEYDYRKAEKHHAALAE